ncbi:MAG: NAD(+) synthase [Candidatus Cloacimonetes bacterium 4572_55]|nr:MAG: NAD(+) synthase [Candidatus Cloacimonetes bacterium 4572_55]
MKLIKIAAAVLNQTPLDWEGNKNRILQAIRIAREEKVSIICMPELCITGYGCEDAFHSSGLQRTAWQILREILPETKAMIVCLGMPLSYQNSIFNVAAIVVDGRILGFTAKQFLAGDGVHYEPRWFKPWPNNARGDVTIEGQSYPIGDIYFDISGIKVGIEICEDAWVARRPGAELALKGVDLILNPSASHFAFGKHEIRKRFVVEGSRAFCVSYIYANLVGCESGRIIYDGGALIASDGKLMAQGPRFSYEDAQIAVAVVDVEKTRLSQFRSGNFQPDFISRPDRIVYQNFDFPELKEAVTDVDANWYAPPLPKEDEFAQAVALGLFDYLRKSRSCGFVVSLSGGGDSAAVSCLVSLMVKLAIKNLGVDRFRQKLSHINDIKDSASDEPEIVNRVLTCVYQATRNSGETTRNAAEKLAKSLNACFLQFQIDGLVESYVRMVSDNIGRELTWDQDDIGLQNIQARVRAPGVWLIANIKRALLLTTSNRSEAAVGYATMDGDTCGGLCPIGGIDKAFLQKWLRKLEKIGFRGIEPIPILKLINEQQPTAELRPKDQNQTDESDLMPYTVLNAIESAAIRDKKMPIQVFKLIRFEFGDQYAAEDLHLWVQRFFRLWSYNQWKRERYAPSFHLDDKNLDPKTWCRFPILSGGFDRELAELQRYIDNVGYGLP